MNLTIDQALKLALEAHRSGRLHDAERLYRLILSAQPKHPDANHNLGILAVEVGRSQEALPHLKTALEENRNHRQFWISYVTGLILTNHLEQARQVLDKEKATGLVDNFFLELEKQLINKLQVNQRDQESPKVDKRKIEITKSLRNKNNYSPSLTPLRPPQQLIDELFKSYRAGKFELVESQALALTQKYPNHPLGWKALGAMLYKTGLLSESLEPMRQSVRLAPNDPEVHSNLGNVLKDLGRLSEAEVSYMEAIRLKPNLAELHNNLGNVLMHLGRLSDSEASYRRAIYLKPNLAEAHSNLGNALKDLGRLREAELSYRKAVSLKQDYAEAHSNLGVTLQELGRIDEAEASCLRAVRYKPELAEAQSNLGNILRYLGRMVEAEGRYREAVRLKPDYAKAHLNLGITLKDLGRLSEAEVSCREVIRLDPSLAEAHSNLGIVLKDLGRLIEAEVSYRQAIQLKPDFAEAHSNLCVTLHDLGRLNEAEAICREAIRLKPDFTEAHSNLGNAIRDLGRFKEAESSYLEAIRLNPANAKAHSNLGNALRDLGRLSDAEARYREAIRLEPKYAKAHSNLGNTLMDLGYMDEAEASFRTAICLEPNTMEYQYKFSLLMPDIHESNASIKNWRQRYESGLNKLIDYEHKLFNPARGTATHTFNLAYQNQSNLHLMKLRSQLAREKVNDCNFIAPHVLEWKKPDSCKIKIAFCSQFFVKHTIGKLYQGLIRKLDRSIFEVVVIHAHESKKDEFSKSLDLTVDRVVHLGPFFSDQLSQVSKERLDIIFYPDIGMYPATYYLAHARLAPVQIVSWGHPDTTGIDTVDYFLSYTIIEPSDADHNYSENLIRLNRLPCYYQPLAISNEIFSRDSLGLSEKNTLYGCPQSLFKIHPDFDPILAEIIERDTKGRIIMFEGTSSAWSRLLRERWEKEHPILNEKVLFLPRLPTDKFLALIADIDVLLDPIHFGSGNTMYESLVYGIPTVTWPGQFMRGRIVAGAYEQMRINHAPVTKELADYARVAFELSKDIDKREYLKDQILRNVREKLYLDISALREFENFLVSTIDAAGKGHRLTNRWTPSSMNGDAN
jgi:protein O-GlcNAc transferase